MPGPATAFVTLISCSAMANELRGVLFDKDGTLVDFDATWQPAYRRGAERLGELAGNPGLADRLMDEGGWDAKRGQWRPGSLLTSASNAQIIDEWLRRTGLETRDSVERLVLDTFHATAIESVVAIDGIDQLFADLDRRGFVLGVATMDDERTARETVRTLSLDSYTRFVCGADSGFGAKPEPGMLFAFCDHAKLEPCEVVMVGDSPHDLNMGRAAGAGLVVGVLSGAHRAEDLVDLADHVVEDATALGWLLPEWAGAA